MSKWDWSIGVGRVVIAICMCMVGLIILPSAASAAPLAPHRASLKSVKQRTATPSSTNYFDAWVGYADTGFGYQAVSAEWTVPSFPDQNFEGNQSVWVGLGGAAGSWTPGNLVQAGTDTMRVSDGNGHWSTTYSAWIEDNAFCNPTPPNNLGNLCPHFVPLTSNVPTPISAGDHMRVRVSSNLDVQNQVYFSIEDLTTGASYSGAPAGWPLPNGSTAEWIVERAGDWPTTSGDIVTFSNAIATRNGPTVAAGLNPYDTDIMTEFGGPPSGTNHVIATPGYFNCDGTTFTVKYGASRGASPSCGGGSSASANLVYNGGFEGGLTNWSLWTPANWATWGANQVGNSPYEGSRFASTNTTVNGGGIYQDIPLTINAGDSFCASAHVVTEGATGGASGTLALFLRYNGDEGIGQTFNNLPGGNGWTLVQTCIIATRSHSSIRVQFYPTPNGPTLSIDAVGVYRNLAQNGGFNTGNFSGWQLWPNSNWAVWGAGQVGNDPYEGSRFASTNTTVSGGGIYQDIPLTVNSGDTFCASAQVVTQGATGGGGGTFALFLRYNTDEGAGTTFSGLPGGNGWTPVQVCITATRSHSSLRVQFYPTPNVTTISMDAVGVHYN